MLIAQFDVITLPQEMEWIQTPEIGIYDKLSVDCYFYISVVLGYTGVNLILTNTFPYCLQNLVDFFFIFCIISRCAFYI